MELAQDHAPSAETTFRVEALRWLPAVARYSRLLTRNQADADDLAQETYLRAFAKWDTFRQGTDCKSWLFAICRHLHFRAHRRGKRFVATEDAEAEVQRTAELFWEAEAHGLQGLFDRIDVAPALERGLREMAPDYRAVVLLVDVEEYSYAEAAVALSIPIGTVRSRLFRARRLLQQALIEHARDLGFASSGVADDTDERMLA
jgi:RNA polymerase sigma-70 factor (ECF subfamily)